MKVSATLWEEIVLYVLGGHNLYNNIFIFWRRLVKAPIKFKKKLPVCLSKPELRIHDIDGLFCPFLKKYGNIGV